MIEVDDMVVEELGPHQQVADDAGIARHCDAERVFDAAHRSLPMHIGAHPAKPLSEEPGIFRVAPLENGFNASEQHPAAPGRSHLTAFDFRLQPQVTLDASHRVDGDSSIGRRR